MNAVTAEITTERACEEANFPRHQPKITCLELTGPASLRLTFDDGLVATVDFAPVIGRNGVMRPLADPAFFARAAIAPDGRSLFWPGELDFCADALWLEASDKAHPLTSR